MVFAAAAAASLVLAGCSTSAVNESVVKKTPVPTLKPCSPEVMKDTKAAIDSSVKEDLASNNVRTSETAKVVDQPGPLLAITKASMLPCEPTIDIENPAANPANVQTIQSVLDLDLWSKLVLANKVGAGNAGSPKMVGFSQPKESYKAFLTVAARFPYYCGENGDLGSAKEACQQELSTLFAHAIQETGEKPVPAGEQVWQTALYQTFEGACYETKSCTDYDGGKEAFDAPADAQYYGRGMKQLSWAYNYAGFSASYYGDMKVLIDNPDLVGTDAALVLGSGIWFAMSPQPPKPSMHDVMLGYYKPKAAADGVIVNQSGALVNRFSTTVSIINGAYECSPKTEMTMQQSKNRYVNLKALLPQFGAPPQSQTSDEQAMVPGTTYCEIKAGNPFVNADLIYNPPTYYDTSKGADGKATCFLIGWQPSPVLSAAAPGMAKYCYENFGSGQTSPPNPPVGPTTEPPSPPSDWQLPSASLDGLEVSLKASGHWDSGYCLSTVVKNNSTQPVSKWYYTFALNPAQRVDDQWGGTVSKERAGYRAMPAAQQIAAGQSVTTLGFCVYDGDQVPTNLTVAVP